MKKSVLVSVWICCMAAVSFAITPKDTSEVMLELSTGDSAKSSDSKAAQSDSLPPIDKMPELKQFVKALYPSGLIKQGVQGAVLLELLVNDSGVVDSVNVVKGLHPALDSSAMIAAHQFRFTPATAGGKPVSVLLQYEYRFTLESAVDSIQKVVNFEGAFIERGTKKPIADAMVVLTFIDTLADTTLPLPFSLYLKKIGGIGGQSLDGQKIVTTTDSLGKFHFFSLPACSVQVAAIVPGYEEFKTKELISRKEAVEAKYYVKRYSYSEYEIVVYGKAEEKEVSRRQLAVQEIKLIPGLGGDAVKVVQAMPGVARPSFGSGEVIVRGAPTWDSKFYLDGMEIPVLYHMGGIKSTYNSNALQGIDFLPGGFGTRYGGAIAGIIELKGKEAATDRWHGSLDLSTIDGSIFVEGPITSKLSILATARRSFVGDILHYITEQYPDQFPMTIATSYWDYVCRLDYKLSKNNHLFLTLFGSGDSMAIIYPGMRYGSKEISDARDQFGMNTTFNMGILGWDYTPNDHWTNTFRYAFTKERSFASPFGFFKSKTGESINNIREQVSYKQSDKLKLNIGADVELMNFDMDLAIGAGNGMIVRTDTNNWLFGDVGAYLNCEWKPVSNLQIIPGIRYDYYPELIYDGSIVPEFWNYTKFNNNQGISGEPSVRLNGRYSLNKEHTIKASIGDYSQTPKPIGQVIIPAWGDPSMPSTKATHYVIGHEWQITDLINSDVQFYYNKQWDIPEFASIDSSKLGQSQNKWETGDGRMYGLEIMLRHMKSEHFFGWVAYTLSRTERYNTKTHAWEVYDQDETNNLQVLGSWHLKKEWDLGFRARYTTGKPETPVVGVIYKEDYTHYSPVYGKTNSSRVDPFFQLDLRVDKKFVFDKWMFSIYLDMQDISYFIYKSPEMSYYQYDYKAKNEISSLPMFGLGYKAEF